MRRSVVTVVPSLSRSRLAHATVVVVASFALMACEDGPNQTYSPAPGGAGNTWNGNQDSGSWADPASKDFTQRQTGQNKQELCTGAEKAKMWAWALQQDIIPPTGTGALDLSGGPTWQGLTVEAAETPVRDSKGALIIPPPKGGGICQGDAIGDRFGDGNQVVSWGDNSELWMHYPVSTRKGNFMLFITGYLGSVHAKSRPGGRFEGGGISHTYEIPVGRQVQKDGMGFNLDWLGAKTPNDWRNELHDAILSSFSALSPSDDCNADRRCIQGAFGDVAYMFIPAVGHAVWVPNQNAAQPTASIPDRIDGDLAKVMPFAFASPLLKIDAEGPTATAKIPNKPDCVLKFGLRYGDFLSNCVQNSGNTTTDTTELNKLLGGLRHGAERYRFDVTGVDVNFTAATLAADKIVSDKDRPVADDVSTEWRIDQSTLGKIQNDYPNHDTTQAPDLHGAGMVYLEYANNVQRELNRLAGAGYTHQLGDAACTAPGLTDAQLQLAKCTGFEGFVTAAPLALAPGFPANAVGIAAKGFGLGGMKPGHHAVTFCNDANGNLSTGYKNCTKAGDTFPQSYNRVLNILGKGIVSNLPVEARDNRFFFKQWFIALVKYLKATGNDLPDGHGANATLAQIDGVRLDSYNLFFDSIGAGQFEIAEYVDRSAVTATSDPVDIVFTADVKNGIMNSFDFSRDLLRGEGAMYTSMIDERGGGTPDAPGKQNTALLTNMFGSPVLAAGWKDHTIKGGECGNTGADMVTEGFYCAINVDNALGKCSDYTVDVTALETDCNAKVTQPTCGGVAGCTWYAATSKCSRSCTITPGSLQTPPLDALNNIVMDDALVPQPVLKAYEGAFGTSRTVWTLGPSPIKIVKTFDNILSATVKVPLHKNPYNLASAPAAGGDSVTVLMPWLTKQPGVGFPVALTGTRDKFIETYQLDLTGNTITANIDYDFAVDPNTHKVIPDAVNFLAVETTDFLGDVFVCQDPITKDLLSARMYTSVSLILDWFSTHPGAYQACQIIVRYSPYGNYADYITSGVAGVRLGITQGGGYGRVVDGTLYDPKAATQQ